MKYSSTLIKAFFLFPVNVMGVIPGFLLWCSRPGGWLQNYSMAFDWPRSITGSLLIALGVYLCWVTVSLFTDFGDGTPAPYAPPKKLVILGIYRHTRNPMMIGIWCVLLGESLLFASLPILFWFLFFFSACLVLIPLWEERDLENRFGEDYLIYKKNVPRWLPRFKPWKEKKKNQPPNAN